MGHRVNSSQVAVLAKEIVALAGEVVTLKRRVFELTNAWTSAWTGERQRINVLEQRVAYLESCPPRHSPNKCETTSLCKTEHPHFGESSKIVASSVASVAVAAAARGLQSSLLVGGGGGGGSYNQDSVTISRACSTTVDNVRKRSSHINDSSALPTVGSAGKRNVRPNAAAKVAITDTDADHATLHSQALSHAETGHAISKKESEHGQTCKELPDREIPTLVSPRSRARQSRCRGRGATSSLKRKQAEKKTTRCKSLHCQTVSDLDREITRNSGVIGVCWHRQTLSWVGYYSNKGKTCRAYFRRSSYRKPGGTEKQADAEALRSAIAWRRAHCTKR
eukprot:TRINITY_DN23676_c0_g1_i1.p1 TRINITY_DN23676_c0_g1~~TRINITY_DN23676_c0_g1_i1.p1  ORF type:complete len:336 (-),score=23.38 TRINITY_DN23676_c0_g1_i1:26-1033(-)